MSENARMEIGLNAAIVSVSDGDPCILRIRDPNGKGPDALPYGRFDPLVHRTMEEGLRELAEAQTGLRPGYVEQLYTFGDRGRMPIADDHTPHVISVGYLALARPLPEKTAKKPATRAEWHSWYHYFPWEDWRSGRPEIIDTTIIPTLLKWADEPSISERSIRGLPGSVRTKIAFGLEDSRWDDELVLDRYELIYSAGLVNEAISDGRIRQRRTELHLGKSMAHDHRRILATAIARLRGKLKYRPVVFELLPDAFTLTELQQTVENIFGRSIHKQNFRRLMENAELVEPTGKTDLSTGGRPAALYRFRSEILKERPAPGIRIG